jgi:L-fuculose-phosphate aldolase
LTPPPADTPPAKLVRYFGWLRKYGLNDSHSGNASCREGESVWITPTGCCADTLAAEDLLFARTDALSPDGASLDAPLHLEVYRQVTIARAVLHSHGPYSIAMTMDGEDFNPRDFEGRYHFGRVPVLSIPHDAYVERSPALVARALASHRVVVVRGHGVYAWGETIDQAYKWTCSLESSARISLLARQAGMDM